MNDIDRVRRELGLPTRPGTSSSARTNRLDIRDVLNRSVSKADSDVVGLGALRTMSWIALGAAVIAAVAHRPLLSSVASMGANSFTHFAYSVLVFGRADIWLPWMAGAVAVALVVMAFMTRGFTRANQTRILTMTGLDTAAVVLAIPVAIVAAMGVAFVAIIAIGVILVVVIAGFILLAGD